MSDTQLFLVFFAGMAVVAVVHDWKARVRRVKFVRCLPQPRKVPDADWSVFVSESAIDYYAVLARGGDNGGDEDFMLVACPCCRLAFLFDAEVDTVFVDPADLNKRLSWSHPFACPACDQTFPEGRLGGEPFLVRWSELEASGWAWAVRRRA